MPSISNKKILLFSGVSFVFFLLVLESGLRLWGEFAPVRVLCYDPILGRSYCANTKGYLKDNKIKTYIEVNSDGLLGKSYPVKRRPRVKRIAVLGDSFTSGEAVTPDKKFTGEWEAKLSKWFPMGVEVINFGVGGTGTWQQLQRFHIKAKKYNPDLTVLVFCWCNDIDNNVDQLKSGSRNPLLNEYQIGFKEKFQVKRKNFNQWIWNNSALYQFTRGRYNHLEHYVKGFFRPEYMKQPGEARNTGTLVNSPPDTISMYDDVFSFNSEGWELTKKLILKLQDEVVLNGGIFAVIPIAGSGQQYRNYTALPVKQFEKFLTANGIHSFNMFEDFNNMNDSDLTANFIPNDGHFSATGHYNFSEFAIEFLVDFLRE